MLETDYFAYVEGSYASMIVNIFGVMKEWENILLKLCKGSIRRRCFSIHS
ncbi:hypothetical protein KHA80_07790 [Anaerobacillus sp. HL2]|nr:hypothetical protein KHA80_07790 [Anaerobacillus sp. HL2]